VNNKEERIYSLYCQVIAHRNICKWTLHHRRSVWDIHVGC